LHPNSEKAFSLGMSQAEPNYREYKYLCENVKSTLVALEGLCQAKNDAETAQKLFCKGIQQQRAGTSWDCATRSIRKRRYADWGRTTWWHRDGCRTKREAAKQRPAPEYSEYQHRLPGLASSENRLGAIQLLGPSQCASDARGLGQHEPMNTPVVAELHLRRQAVEVQLVFLRRMESIK